LFPSLFRLPPNFGLLGLYEGAFFGFGLGLDFFFLTLFIPELSLRIMVLPSSMDSY
jgi:hypothetical protein